MGSLIEMNGTTVVVPKWLFGWFLTILTTSVVGLVGMVFGLNAKLSDMNTRVAITEREGSFREREHTSFLSALSRLEARLEAHERDHRRLNP